MTRTVAYLTPAVADLAVKTGRRRFRKKILPLEEIDYNGRKIDFNKEYLADLVQSFSDEAYDQVPFVLADENNAHNELPERFRGELDSLELTDDGLYGMISTTSEGAKLLSDNPKLGVSARIIEGLGKSDGRVFKRVIRHICGTMDPRVTNLGPWQPVDLSDESTETIETVDLSAAHFIKKGTAMPKPKAKSTARKSNDGVLDLSTLSDEQFEALLEFSASLNVEDEDDTDEEIELDENGNPILGEEDDSEDDSEDDEVETEVEVEEEETDAVNDKKTNKKTKVLAADLSNTVLDAETRNRVHQMQIDLAQERFATARSNWVRDGVPPFLVDLAADILASPEGAVIDLSNTDAPVNAADVITQMLDGVKGMMDLTTTIGHQVDLSESEATEQEQLLASWTSEYGTV